jgi:membrane-associated PAP2 superfamily phosphatase
VDKDNSLGKLFFYNGPKVFVIIPIGVMLGILFVFPRKVLVKRGWGNRWFANKRALGLCIAAMIIIPLSCNKTKSISNVYCPYDITRYGGHAPYIRVFEEYPEDFAKHQQEKKEQGAGFPAGHASGGFALMCLAMLARTRRWQIGLVCVGTALGWWMGGYQMLRGAHYLSHTLVTWVVAAIVITILAKFLPKRIAPCCENKVNSAETPAI